MGTIVLTAISFIGKKVGILQNTSYDTVTWNKDSELLIFGVVQWREEIQNKNNHACHSSMCVKVIMLQPKFRYYASIKNWIMLLQIQKFETNTTLLEIGENYATLRYHGVAYSDDK